MRILLALNNCKKLTWQAETISLQIDRMQLFILHISVASAVATARMEHPNSVFPNMCRTVSSNTSMNQVVLLLRS